MDWIIVLLSFVIAYLLGSIPTSVWVGKWFYDVDVRKEGSGNAGATNTIRVLGYKAGIPVLIFDMLKGALAVVFCRMLTRDSGVELSTYYSIIAAVFAVVGHIFPVFVGFKGGKGVATVAGAVIALFPLGVLVPLGVFVLVMILFNYVSLSSMLAAISFPFSVIFLIGETNPGLIALSILVAIFIPVTHKKNIQRLLKGEESKFFKKKKKNND
ncbi:MAG: glycerol-3-phosphate 1-O-acyltransferase PlsY [Bacteroidales bacterium]